ncbi:MAG: ubiquinone/menaquinone biosynthesis methyltransferase [Caldilineaceae bacterium]|nr:ubiquinone/menaquinone biosynthesis methyltransferase [Caldilineaceae bacterium]
MTNLPSLHEKAGYVNRMFADIAPRYDLMNRLMTGGQDMRWRVELIKLCDLPPHGKLLDVGTGTGDIAYEALRQHPSVTAIGCDFTFEMMAVGQGKSRRAPVYFAQGDGLRLPFPDHTFDAVTSGFLLRNVVDIDAALSEQRRVTKPGGRVICLETTPPSQTLSGPLVRFHMFRVIPLLGRIISPRGNAYQYLPQSTTVFPEPKEMARKMERAGLKHVFYRKKMLGTVAIHVGTA